MLVVVVVVVGVLVELNVASAGGERCIYYCTFYHI